MYVCVGGCFEVIIFLKKIPTIAWPQLQVRRILLSTHYTLCLNLLIKRKRPIAELMTNKDYLALLMKIKFTQEYKKNERKIPLFNISVFSTFS